MMKMTPFLSKQPDFISFNPFTTRRLFGCKNAAKANSQIGCKTGARRPSFCLPGFFFLLGFRSSGAAPPIPNKIKPPRIRPSNILQQPMINKTLIATQLSQLPKGTSFMELPKTPLNNSHLKPLTYPGMTKKSAGYINLGAFSPSVVSALLFASLFFLLAPDAWAMKEDGMKEGLTALESILTGNFTRLAVICGSMWGAFQAYVKSSPMLLGGAVATGLGTNFLMSWASSTWAVTI